jgi:hypothetical protein
MKWKKRKLKWKNDKNYQKPREITGLKKIIYEFKTIYFKKGRKIISIDYDEYIKALDKRIKRLTDIRNWFIVPKKRKYGHNPDLIKRDEEIVIDYNILRQEDVIPGECLMSLALEYELSPATIDDIVKGKTKRKKKLG